MRTGIQGRGAGFRLVRDWRHYDHTYNHTQSDLEFWSQFITPQEAADALGVSVRVVNEQIQNAIEG